MTKLLKDIKGFDDVGIGVIHRDAGEGEYILCKDLKDYDLTNVQTYKYNTFFRTMSKANALGEDSDIHVYCVRRHDLM